VSSIDANPTQPFPRPPASGAADPTVNPADHARSERLSRAERVGLLLHRGLDKWLTPLGIWITRRTNGAVTDSRIARLLGAGREVDVLLLTTRGRRSGRDRTVVLQYFPDGDAMVVTAANDGGASHPGWYFNLQGDPCAQVEVLGRTMGVHAEELPADAASAWWQRIVSRDPNYERYARATSRPFPIVRLVPTAERPAKVAAQASQV
jgi:deazaflavin-dependent oxidoreductase (nitroreductase family)